jgi:hypothetical protein
MSLAEDRQYFRVPSDYSSTVIMYIRTRTSTVERRLAVLYYLGVVHVSDDDRLKLTFAATVGEGTVPPIGLNRALIN